MILMTIFSLPLNYSLKLQEVPPQSAAPKLICKHDKEALTLIYMQIDQKDLRNRITDLQVLKFPYTMSSQYHLINLPNHHLLLNYLF